MEKKIVVSVEVTYWSSIIEYSASFISKLHRSSARRNVSFGMRPELSLS